MPPEDGRSHTRHAEALSTRAQRVAGGTYARPAIVARRLAALGPHSGALVALVSGAVVPLAFAPFGVYPLAVLAPAVLFLLLEGCTPRHALWRGWLFGVGLFGTGVSWVYESFHFSHIGPGVAAPLTVAFVLFLALYTALPAWLAVRVVPNGGGVRLALALPGAWLVFEWLRGWLFTGFTWLDLGYSQTGSPLAGFAPVGGVYLVGLAVLVSAGLLALALRTGGRRAVAALFGAGALWLAGAGLRTVSWVRPAGAPLSVVLVQGNVPQDQKWLPSMREPTLQRYMRLTRRHWGARLVLWPETALPDLEHRLRGFIAELDREARAHHADVLFGVPAFDPLHHHYLNRVVVVGMNHGVYDKRHLVPFGEYLPLDRWLRPVTDYLGIPVADFWPGRADQPLPVLAGYPVDVSICYEIAFGDEIARSLPRAAFLVTVSNDAWFGESIAQPQNLQIARMRSLETGRWLLRATNTGISAIIAPDGRVVARAPQYVVATVTGTVTPMRGATPYVRLLDWPAVGLALTLLVAGGLAAPRRRS